MKHGVINCTCGQQFYFEKVEKIVGYDNDNNPIYDESNVLMVNCPQCKEVHNVSEYPKKPEEPINEVGEEDGIDI